MITDQRIRDYIGSLDRGNGALLDAIEERALRDRVPIAKKETQALLKTMVVLTGPEKILEVGTAVGFSALLMAGVMPEHCHITTIEKYEKRIPEAKANFAATKMEDRITLLEGDAEEILAGLEPGYGLIFMDAAKGQYINWLPQVRRLLVPGGLLISDNVLQDGETALSRYAVGRRDRTIHTRIREYIWELTHCDDFETAILPVGDGVALSVKK
ncbi:MAG: O-methyltransferase [Clostridium sp.]|nr:O-methyltransferase [Clostridium sp.]